MDLLHQHLSSLVTIAFWGLALAGLAVVLWALFGDRGFRQARCPRCWYDMRGRRPGRGGLVCPECGHDAGSEGNLYHRRRSRRQAIIGGLMLLVAAGGLRVWQPLAIIVTVGVAGVGGGIGLIAWGLWPAVRRTRRAVEPEAAGGCDDSPFSDGEALPLAGGLRLVFRTFKVGVGLILLLPSVGLLHLIGDSEAERRAFMLLASRGDKENLELIARRTYDPVLPRWVLGWVPYRFAQCAYRSPHVLLEQYGSLDESLGRLSGLPHLSKLTIQYADKVTPAAWQQLRACRELRCVIVESPILNGESLRNLAGVDQLETLSLAIPRGSVTNEDILSLRNMPHLKDLSLYGEMTDQLVEQLEPLKHLGKLGLSGYGVTDAAIPSFLRMTSLDTLCLSNTAITPAGLARLAGHPGLRAFRLYGDTVWAGHVVAVIQMKQLRTLRLSRSASEIAEAIERLRRERPDLEIVLDSG